MTKGRSRNCWFTINNFTEGTIELLKNEFEAGKISYLIVAIKYVPAPHLLGCIQFKQQTRYIKLARKLNANFRKCSGLTEDVIKVWFKSENFVEMGKFKTITINSAKKTKTEDQKSVKISSSKVSSEETVVDDYNAFYQQFNLFCTLFEPFCSFTSNMTENPVFLPF
ncbi:unnamed protein product [Blepharisma stoltei]|uniref:Uncharacterized protein n=1 Tax=Blepharisma stoltei TaxID=1481888 RepID=A0AAU9J984_9CILI|nr:unnamed protein product [Blepharisma stoltei]